MVTMEMMRILLIAMEVIKRAAARRKRAVRMSPFNLGEADTKDRVRSPEGCRLQIAYSQGYVIDIPEDDFSLGIACTQV